MSSTRPTKVQAQAVQNFSSDERTLTDLVNRSQSALNKVAALCEVMDVHPLTLLTLSYAGTGKQVDQLFARVQRELDAIAAKAKL